MPCDDKKPHDPNEPLDPNGPEPDDRVGDPAGPGPGPLPTGNPPPVDA